MDSIEWDDNCHDLRDVIAHRPLPCLVKVIDGHYDRREETTLSNGDILVLHRVSSTRSYRAHAEDGRELLLPQHLQTKVQTIETNVPQSFENVKQLSEAFPEKVVSTHSHPWLGIMQGDVLRLDRIVEPYLQCSFINKLPSAANVRIPLSYQASFQTVEDDVLWLGEVENKHRLPVIVKFKDESIRVTQRSDDDTEKEIKLADLGRVMLHDVHTKEVILVSDYQCSRNSLLRVPVELGITVTVAVDGVTKFAGLLCDVGQWEEDIDSIRIGNHEAMVETIYEDMEETHDYEEAAPAVPPRDKKPTLSSNSSHKTSDTSSALLEKNSSRSKDGILSRNTNLSDGDDDDDDDDDESDYEDYEQYEDVFHREKSSESNVRPPPPPPRSTSLSSSSSQMNANDKPVPSGHTDYASQQNPYEINSTTQLTNQNKSLPILQMPLDDVTDQGGFCFPDKLEHLSVQDVGDCLVALHMSEYSDKFAHQLIDGSMLMDLTEDMLTGSLDMRDKLHRVKLMKFINGWRPV